MTETSTTTTTTARRDTPRCASISREHGESLRGTAAVAAGWLLIEHPGPWGPAPFGADGPLGPFGVDIAQRCARVQVRPQLIRDPQRPRTDTDGLRVFLVHSGRGGSWIEQHHYCKPEDLLDLDITPAATGIPPRIGDRVEEPVYLVCTHGKKDPCCAVFGRPLVRALAGVSPRLFESSHLGGDRFAGGMVALPDGSYYGHMSPATARQVVARHDAGHLTLAHYRGRCTDVPAVQTAEHAVRTLRALTAIAAVESIRTRPIGDQDSLAVLTTDGADVTVRVTTAPEPPRRTACHAAELITPDHGKITSIRTRPHPKKSAGQGPTTGPPLT